MSSGYMWTGAGYSAMIESGDWRGLWAAEGGEHNKLTLPITIGSAAVDAGNTPTTVLRAGSILGLKTSDSKYYLYDPDGTDGTQVARCVLPVQLPMLNQYGVAGDRFGAAIFRANFKVGSLHNYDAAAGSSLIQNGCVLDNPAGAQANGRWIGSLQTSGSVTLTAAQSGLMIRATTTAAFTLPTKARGLRYWFSNQANTDLTILSAGSADDIVADGDAGADSVAFSTSSHKIGSSAYVECDYLSTNLMWFVHNLGGTAATPT